jgi:fatty acid desaturase
MKTGPAAAVENGCPVPDPMNVAAMSLASEPTTSMNRQFSLAEARAIVRDLFAPDERIYWADFLLTIGFGHGFFAATRWIIDSSLPFAQKALLGLVTFTVQCACIYRAVMFVHEIVHLPERKFRAFRVAWNLLCGIPFLLPSFTYYSHLDHHRRRLFGTAGDGEYLALGRMSPGWILVYLSQCLWVPPLVVVRFAILTPLMTCCPPLARWIYQHASALVMDPSYTRPLPTRAALRWMRLQEGACCVFVWGVVASSLLVLGRWPLVLAIHAYGTSVVLVLMNCVRTLASHRWGSDGHEQTFVEQMLDSVTLDSDSLTAALLNPVGLRYHATHHLFPSLPYHNMRAAHKRLLAQLPPDSAYRQTVVQSLWPVIADLWRRATASQQVAPASQEFAPHPLRTMNTAA